MQRLVTMKTSSIIIFEHSDYFVSLWNVLCETIAVRGEVLSRLLGLEGSARMKTTIHRVSEETKSSKSDGPVKHNDTELVELIY